MAKDTRDVVHPQEGKIQPRDLVGSIASQCLGSALGAEASVRIWSARYPCP